MQSVRRQPERSNARRGLAPLEFVAALPFIVFLAALMVVVGGAGLVKSRAQVNVRYAMTRSSGALRNPGGDPNPHNWARPATVVSGGGAALSSSEAIWSTLADNGSVRGGGSFVGMRVDGQLEIGSSVHTGEVRYRRPIPLLRKVSPKQNYAIDLVVETVDNEWQYYAGGMHFGGNQGRRADPWYGIDPSEVGGNSAQSEAELKAAQNEMRGAAFATDLDPLDRDEELRAHFRSYRDFHPGVSGCETNIINSPIMEGFLRRIDEVPIRMADAHIRMYRDRMNDEIEQRDQLEAQLQQLQTQLRQAATDLARERNQPMPNAGTIANLQRRIADLQRRLATTQQSINALNGSIAEWQAKIDQMEQFKATYDGLRGV